MALRPFFSRFLSLFVAISISAVSISAYSASTDDPWKKVGSGEHSMRTLGSDFWVDVPVKRAEGARLLLFNHALASRLGLDLPADAAELEKLILDKFAWVVAKEGETSEKSFIATRYQDSGHKGAGEALGDGRALWTGELEIPMKDGRILYVDFTAKGVGQTPLAWLNHPDPLHKDGLQSTEEAVHSFTMSEINLRNKLDSVGDLAVIELPFLKMDKHTKTTAKASLTIRVGNQTRIAHYKYFSDNQSQFKKIFEYSVARDLGLPLKNKLKKSQVVQYLDEFTKNLAEESARYYDLHAVHASPTSGNRTTRGATIDLGTFRYLDAHHGEYTYLFDRLKLADQTDQLKSYVDDIFRYAYKANYPLGVSLNHAEAKFEEAFTEELTQQWFRRLGLDSEAVSKVDKPLKKRFFKLMTEINETLGVEKVVLGGDRMAYAAAYEPREILKRAIQWQRSQDGDWADLLKSSREWSKPSAEKLKKHADEFGSVMKALVTAIGPSDAQLIEWQARAEVVGGQSRLPPGRKFFEDFEKPALEAIRSGKGSAEISETIWRGVDALVDLGVQPRPTAHLGLAPRIGVFSGTFDPPHLGHETFIAQVMEAYQLDHVYIIPNPSSDHKVNVTNYELRKEMTIATFSKNKKVTVGDPMLEDAFRRGDMTEVLNTLHESNPISDLVQIMGDDSFDRLQKVSPPLAGVTAIIVNPRTPGVKLPATLRNIPVLNGERMRTIVSSSTKIRVAIASNKKKEINALLNPKVLKIIEREKLYSQGSKEPCAQWFSPFSLDALGFNRD